jgi:hypothetical protein
MTSKQKAALLGGLFFLMTGCAPWLERPYYEPHKPRRTEPCEVKVIDERGTRCVSRATVCRDLVPCD